MDTRTFVVPIHDLDSAGREVSFDLPASWLRGVLEGCEMQPAGPDGELTARVSKTGTDVLVRGRVHVELEVACARCLAPVRLRPEIELSLLLEPRVVDVSHVPGSPRVTAAAAPELHGRLPWPRPADAGPSKARGVKSKGPKHKENLHEVEYEFGAGEAEKDTYEGEEIVLDPFVREAILLESPTFPLCSETCEGIRPRQADEGAKVDDRAPDPRLAPLIELAKRRTTKE